jgi:hypothetical protein
MNPNVIRWTIVLRRRTGFGSAACRAVSFSIVLGTHDEEVAGMDFSG